MFTRRGYAVIKAIVFDFDGLIIDTETPWYLAYKEVFKRYEVDLTMEIWGACIGTTFDAFDPHDYLREQSGQPVTEDEIIAETRAIFNELMAEQGLRAGVLDYLTEAKSLGLGVGLATSSNRKWIDMYFEKLGIGQFFDTVHTADDVERVKPDPELYLKAMQSLGVKGNETIVFEDSLNGLKAAKAAGAYCVIVPNSVTSFMDFEHYDLRLPSMADMSLVELVERVGR